MTETSIGIAPNKAIAKIASDFRKPDGLTVTPDQKVPQFLAPLPVSKISGVGKKSGEKLAKIGIGTIGQLARTYPSKLYDVFGRYRTRIWQVANGIGEDEVVTSWLAKSISSETTFDEDVSDQEIIMNAFDSIINDVHKRLQSQHMVFRTVSR